MKSRLGQSESVGPFSPGIAVDGLVFLSGQLGIDAATGAIVGPGIVEQTRQAMRSVAALLAEGGMTTDDLVSVTCYLTDIEDWPAMNREYAEHFGGTSPLPARTAFAVAALPLGARVELTCIAAVPSTSRADVVGA